jgi:hypothetical protein
MEVLDVPAHMLTPILSGHRHHYICGCLAIRGVFQSPINQPAFVAHHVATETALKYAKYAISFRMH